jgi:hypothetical protein
LKLGIIDLRDTLGQWTHEQDGQHEDTVLPAVHAAIHFASESMAA